MKKRITIYCFIVATISQLFLIPTKISALNYTITFTGSGASSSVENVIVQNLTKGTSVTVPNGNVLILSDVTTSIEDLSDLTYEISIFSDHRKTKTIATFYAKQTGLTQINVFSLDGKKIISTTKTLTQGVNTFEFALPKGTYVFSIRGNGYNYKTKTVCNTDTNVLPRIIFSNYKNKITTESQKVKNTAIYMTYDSGDQLLYKGISGIFSTYISDKPIESKNVNFDFIACTDADGNNYSTVQIGTQIWMAENLNTTKYRDGSLISNIADASNWNSTDGGAYCDHQNNPYNSLIFGKLYNWYAVTENRNICPIGWHVPTNSEWTILSTYLGGDNIAGGKLKETGNSHWSSPNTGATNEAGFTALPSGYRDGGSGAFSDLTSYACWWSTDFNSNPWSYFPAVIFNSDVKTTMTGSKLNGFSIRCIKD